jgi:hypothetical protein
MLAKAGQAGVTAQRVLTEAQDSSVKDLGSDHPVRAPTGVREVLGIGSSLCQGLVGGGVVSWR